jgi:hypothetical protein
MGLYVVTNKDMGQYNRRGLGRNVSPDKREVQGGASPAGRKTMAQMQQEKRFSKAEVKQQSTFTNQAAAAGGV